MPLNPVRETLIKAKALITDPKNWTQGAYARTGDGVPVPLSHSAAVCFCSMGAIRRISGELGAPYQALKREIGPSDMVCEYNDSHTHEEVLALFDKAIEAQPECIP